ncbi:glycerate kinase, partial [Virgibacillus salexigens]|uniref:glycerate kinase n=1 Tax=Virgibacillus salexigens TaxID=61016 RepID=UPI003081293C
MAEALGVRFYNDKQQLITVGGGERLIEVAEVDTSELDKRLHHIPVDVACNWKNVPCGNQGVARIFGPQKGATPSQVDLLSEGFERYATVI